MNLQGQFPLRMWNVHQRNMEERTTNAVESFHNKYDCYVLFLIAFETGNDVGKLGRYNYPQKGKFFMVFCTKEFSGWSANIFLQAQLQGVGLELPPREKRFILFGSE